MVDRELDEYGRGGWRGHRLRVALFTAGFWLRRGRDVDDVIEQLDASLQPLREMREMGHD